MRLAGGMMIAAAYLQWFLPMLLGQAGTFPQHIVLGTIFLATGAGIYLFASRGFRKVLFIDLANRCVEVALADSRKTKVTLRSFPMAAIESVFVKPSDGSPNRATLNLRIKGRANSFAVLRGERDELDGVHRKLCHDVHAALECRPRRVTARKVSPISSPDPRPARPMRQRVARPAAPVFALAAE